MSNFKVLWCEPGSTKRMSRKFESAMETQGFIKGLRAAKTPEDVALRYLGEANEYQRVAIPDFFTALERPKATAGSADGAPAAPADAEACAEDPPMRASA